MRKRGIIAMALSFQAADLRKFLIQILRRHIEKKVVTGAEEYRCGNRLNRPLTPGPVAEWFWRSIDAISNYGVPDGI